MNFTLGIDFGTSGARAIVIDEAQIIQFKIKQSFRLNSNSNLAILWQNSLFNLIEQIPSSLRQSLSSIAINGTSATVLLCDQKGHTLDQPILYNDNRGQIIKSALEKFVPPNHLTLSATSSLSKLVWWSKQPIFKEANYFLHQADWLAFLLHGQLGSSDYHNALKLGYDVEQMAYPNWLINQSFYPLLPRIIAPGTIINTITLNISRQFNIPQSCVVCGGTTDSIAAFIASGTNQAGEAVTSLGSTLVLKLLSTRKVDNYQYGIYSHRYGQFWLTGGASNTGGTVLTYFFSDEELVRLSQQINPQITTKLDYYPLLKRGERFPFNDPNLLPKLEPRPYDSVEFLQGLLESMAKIEGFGYDKLKALGATPLKRVYTAGGGAKNKVWQQIRERILNVPVTIAPQTEAAYGTALLAQNKGI